MALDGGCKDYELESVSAAFGRVLCGRKPHFERCNVYTHLFAALVTGALLAVVHALSYFEQSGGDVALSRVAGWFAVATFAWSSAFHVLRVLDPKKVRNVAAVAYAIDQTCVFISLTLSAAATSAAWVGTQRDWRTVMDPVLAGSACTLFVLTRHFIYDRTEWTLRYPNLNVCRKFDYDGMHTATSNASALCIGISVYLCVPALYASVADHAASAVVVVSVFGMLVMALGRALEGDTGTHFEDVVEAILAKRPRSTVAVVVSTMRRCGAVVTGHTLWHVLSMLAACLDIVQREVALASRPIVT